MEEEKTPQQEYDEFWAKIQEDDTFAGAISHLCKKDFFSYITTLYYLINCNKFMLCDFHQLIIKKLQDIVDGKNTKRNLALCLPVGCVSGDTLIRYKRGLSQVTTIQNLFQMLNGKKPPTGYKWNKKIETKVRSYIANEDKIKLNTIEKVTYSGCKDVYLLTLEDGKNIKATIDHKIMTKNGWKELGSLTTDDFVMVDLVADREKYSVKSYTVYGYSKVKSVEFFGRTKTYDIWCYDNHNFSANDIIVHNSGKSLLTEYFISWCFARSRDNAFVYTSHSEDLITKMSAEIRNICTSPQWVRLFGWRLKKDDRQKTNFSFEGAKNRTGLRAKAINSAITGLDAGNPAVDGFSGALIIDDAMDAGNAIYEVERENIVRVYNEKLSTRRRTANTPTILIMQRLHPEDLVGWAEREQPDLWDVVKVKALDEDGNSFWEKRYPAEELKMLQKRQPSLFQAQYQQEPIISGGTIIHTDWFKYYDVHPKYERIFITADTAMKVKEWNDYSVFQVWGKFQNSLYLIDMYRGKWEIPDLIQKAQSLARKYKLWENRLMLSAMYIEDRGSGVGLIQQLRQTCAVPILPLKPNKKDKVTRLKDVVYFIESGAVFLPQDKNYAFNVEFLSECEMFSADGSAKHDDIIDTLVYALQVGLAGIGCSIFD